MADTLTVTNAITRIRQAAHMENSTFVTDAELILKINYSYKDFYDLLVESVEDYNLTETSFTISSGNTYTLPTDFYKMRGLDDLSDSSRPLTVKRYGFSERNDFSDPQIATPNERFSDVRYRIQGANLVILPSDRAARNYKIFYVPIPADLTAGGDSMNGINGWLQYVILDVAIYCLAKEESDTTDLLRMKNDIAAKIAALKRDRDQGMPEKISRIRSRRRNLLSQLDSAYYED